MAEALGGRKRKRRGEAKASGLGNAESVVKTAEQRKTRSASREEVALVARPVRERKPVDRFVAGAPQPRKVGESMAFSIEQGPGTKLQDIPNVVFKLLGRKDDENIQVLHTILYGRKSNAKERAKVKEWLAKCNKERLLVLCELLNVPDAKATTKKGEISAKLLEFLESPHVTGRDVLTENRGRKCKRIKESSQKASGETLPNTKNKKRLHYLRGMDRLQKKAKCPLGRSQ
ncbi:DEK domain-containing chromatin-associated protein 2 isoform X2 [Elaeis guineensis]|uniref:DEK domain-containing chromatin-associated protein 2 isoform X2 n=1 Tax=Elaeis guineensis var. tenera TaxID=51953 RepID=UPI003C6CC66F